MSTTSLSSPLARPLARYAAVAAVALAVAALAGFGAWAAKSTDASTAQAARDGQLSAAYEQARLAAAQVQVAELNYPFRPTSTAMARVDAAEAALGASLAAISSNGDASDRALAARLSAQMGGLQAALARLMDAANRWDAAAVDRIVQHDVHPKLDQLIRAIDFAADAHRAGLSAGLSSARRSQTIALGSTLMMSFLGLLLTAAVAVVLRFKRNLDHARRAEIERLRAAAVTDSLTGLANHRAFHERLEELISADRGVALVMMDLDGLKHANDSRGHQAGDELLKGLARALRQVAPDGDAFRVGGDEFAVVLEGCTSLDGFHLSQELRHALGTAAPARPVAATSGVAERDAGESAQSLVRRADLALIAAKRANRSVLVYSPDVDNAALAGEAAGDGHHMSTLATALARAVDAKDSHTHSHCETVAELCAMIAVELGLPADRVVRIRLAGLLHDVGKIGVSDAILQKPGPLTADEMAVMRTHPTLGAHIVSAAELREEARWIRHHHERLDGRGYPDGLGGDAVPLESRIIMVADAFEAITSDRPYRPRRPAVEALAELRRHAGTQFDPQCLAALHRIVGDIPTSGNADLSAAA